MAPFGPASSARFAGGHLRGKIRVGELSPIGVRLALSGEYSFNRAIFDDELQTMESRSVLDFLRGRLSLVANPSLEIVTRGPEGGALEPVFDLSARAAWQFWQRAAITSEYFSTAATTRHLRPESEAHHLLFAGVDVAVNSRWGLTVSAGRCVTGGDPWLMKSVIALRFH